MRNGDHRLPKIQGNRDRDRRKQAALEAAGWTVLSYRGHDDPEAPPTRSRPWSAPVAALPFADWQVAPSARPAS